MCYYKKLSILCGLFLLIGQVVIHKPLLLQATTTAYHQDKRICEVIEPGNKKAKYCIAENIDKNKYKFDTKIGKSVQDIKWRTYQNKSYGYEFQYPNSYTIEELSGIVLLKGEKSEWQIQVDEIASYPGAEFDPTKMSFEDFAIAIVKLMCDADGPDMSRYCTDIVNKNIFNNQNKLKTIELYLTEVLESHFEGEEIKVEKRIKGPIYIVSISREKESYRGLFFDFIEDVENIPTEKEIMILKEIVNSVKILIQHPNS